MQRCGIHGCVVVCEEAVSESLSNAVCDVGGFRLEGVAFFVPGVEYHRTPHLG